MPHELAGTLQSSGLPRTLHASHQECDHDYPLRRRALYRLPHVYLTVPTKLHKCSARQNVRCRSVPLLESKPPHLRVSRMAQDTLVSCLCVTERRPTFMPWLMWCFERQTWPNRELIIVDSSPEPFQIVERDDIRVVASPIGTSVGRKRNLALQEARGEVITWFDDDDWQHPNKLTWLIEAFGDESPCAGSRRGWFMNLMDSRCVSYRGPKGIVTFNSAAFRKEAVLPIRFREDLRCASDTHWMRALEKRYPGKAALIERDDLFFWLCHEQNLSNPARKRRFTENLTVLRRLVGLEAWGDTDRMLEELRIRLYGEEKVLAVKSHRGQVPAGSISSVESSPQCHLAINGDHAPNLDATQRVGLMIKATVMDALYLDKMVRHMIAQARYHFAERVIVVDRPLTFKGKYASRARCSEDELDKVLDQLLADGVIDRIREVDTTPSVVRDIKERFFASDADRIPNYAATGGPNYPTLYGLESMSTDLVLQMDADVFFYANVGVSWVEEALDVMNRAQQIWLMMTHPGPPAGPPGKSLRSRNARCAIWDPELGIWRFHSATTRYFLCNRRKLHDRLRFVPMSQGCAPLEQCISRSLHQCGAFRGALGDLRSWHLHAWYHGDPFPQWVGDIARSIESGRVPASQRGDYDLRLDRPQDRKRWADLLAIEGTMVPSDKKSAGGLEVRPDRQARDPDRSRVIGQAAADVDIAGDMTSDVDTLTPSVNQGASRAQRAPIAVVIPVRNRAGARVRNALRSLQWQTAGRPAQTLVVSHGSQPDINEGLSNLCNNEGATLLTLGSPADPWNKPLALNTGLRGTLDDVPFVMTMDVDMILAPNFLAVVLDRLSRNPPALVLCRISDLPAHASIPTTGDQLKRAFENLHARSRLRPCYGSGGVQAAQRSFFFDIRGYDEDLAWWGAMDGDIVNRARLVGVKIEWIEDRTAMLHQWHPRKHSILSDRQEIELAKRAWRTNHALVRSRATVLTRNPSGWGGAAE